MMSEGQDSNTLRQLIRVHNSLLIPGYGIVIVYIQTFLVFPAVMLHGGIDFIDSISWEVWFVISIFDFTDTISRYLSERYALLNSNTAAIVTVFRTALIGV